MLSLASYAFSSCRPSGLLFPVTSFDDTWKRGASAGCGRRWRTCAHGSGSTAMPPTTARLTQVRAIGSPSRSLALSGISFGFPPIQSFSLCVCARLTPCFSVSRCQLSYPDRPCVPLSFSVSVEALFCVLFLFLPSSFFVPFFLSSFLSLTSLPPQLPERCEFLIRLYTVVAQRNGRWCDPASNLSLSFFPTYLLILALSSSPSPGRR